jgi:hypothetical protein
MRAFDRLLIKVPEHTWGVAQVNLAAHTHAQP